VADVGEEEIFVDGDVGGVLIGGGVGGALIGVSFPPHVRLATLLLVILLFLHLFFPFLSSSLSLSLIYGHLAIKWPNLPH
jgi:hypothetical protein